MPIQKFANFLTEELYEETIKNAEELLSIGSNVFCTNRWWDFNIRKDSYPVLVHNIDQESQFHKSLKEQIEDKTKSKIVDNNIMLYYWTRHSYIPWHNDGTTYKGAVTIYLNREWDIDYGGYFVYDDCGTIKAIVPEKNLGLMQYGNVLHCTTPVNFNGDIRFTVQTFLKN